MLNTFTLLITAFSTGGVMGWGLWSALPALACSIIAIISLVQLIQPHIVPSEKQIDKLNRVADFYFDFYLQLEKLWFDYEHKRISDEQVQEKFHSIKQQEREINSIVNDVHRKEKRTLVLQAEDKCNQFFSLSFNTTKHE